MEQPYYYCKRCDRPHNPAGNCPSNDWTPFNPERTLLVVSDSWDRLRGCDVDRLIVDEAGKSNAPEMIRAIKHHRPDLIPQAKKAWEYLSSK